MNISYDWYRLFCAVADCKSITLASEKLYISQPAVSQGIRQLEEAIGCPLFLRTPKGVRLTAEGQLIYGYATAGLRSIDEGERRLREMMRLESGEIKIGASDMTLEFCLLCYLEKFHARHPGVKIAITNNPTPQTIELLRQGRIDFAAVSEPVSCDGFEKIPVREIRDIFICGRDFVIPDGVRISDLADRLILLEGNTSTRSYLDAEFRKRGFVASPKFELATSPQIVSFASRNMGIGCVVADFAERAIADGAVRPVAVSDPLPPRSICIVRGEKEHSRAADELLRMIVG